MPEAPLAKNRETPCGGGGRPRIRNWKYTHEGRNRSKIGVEYDFNGGYDPTR